MATLKQRVHRMNSDGTYDTVHYETQASLVLYTNNSQSTVSGALDKLFTDMSGKAASSHNHAGSAITSGTVAAARLGTMTGATTSADGASGAVPKPAKGAATRYLRSDGTWQVPPDTNTVYTHPTTAGNKHIPAGGSSGQFLGWDSAGTAKWVANPNTDTKVSTKLATTTKAYLLGTSTTPTSTAKAVTALSDTGVYLDTTAGTLHATKFTGDGSGLTNIASAGNGLKSISGDVSGTMSVINDAYGSYESSDLMNATIHNTIKDAIFIWFDCNITFTITHTKDNSTNNYFDFMLYGKELVSDEYRSDRVICVYKFPATAFTSTVTSLSIPIGLYPTVDNLSVPPGQIAPIVFRSAYGHRSTIPTFVSTLEGVNYLNGLSIRHLYFTTRPSTSNVTKITYSGTITYKYIYITVKY